VIIHVIITVEFAMAIQFGEVDTNLYVQTRYVQICAGSLMQRDAVTPLIKEVALYCSFACIIYACRSICKWKHAKVVCFNSSGQYRFDFICE